jgi:hypothetical protein
MKTLLIFLISFAFYCFSFSQKAMHFNVAKNTGIHTSQLDSIYLRGIHADTSLAVFKTNAEEYIAAYQKLLQDFGKHLKANNFIWEKATKGFNRIYFNKEGKIDYFLYSFRPDQLTTEQEKRFDDLLNKFVAVYQFPLKAKSNFAQCSPVTYMPEAK